MRRSAGGSQAVSGDLPTPLPLRPSPHAGPAPGYGPCHSAFNSREGAGPSGARGWVPARASLAWSELLIVAASAERAESHAVRGGELSCCGLAAVVSRGPGPPPPGSKNLVPLSPELRLPPPPDPGSRVLLFQDQVLQVPASRIQASGICATRTSAASSLPSQGPQSWRNSWIPTPAAKKPSFQAPDATSEQGSPRASLGTSDTPSAKNQELRRREHTPGTLRSGPQLLLNSVRRIVGVLGGSPKPSRCPGS